MACPKTLLRIERASRAAAAEHVASIEARLASIEAKLAELHSLLRPAAPKKPLA